MPSLNEVRASAPAGIVIVETLEIYHASFPEPIRICNQLHDFTATLEDSAPRDAGEEVAFSASSFALVLPRAGSSGIQTINIKISNIDLMASDHLEIALENPGAVSIIFRIYLSSDTSGPAENPPTTLTLQSAVADSTFLTAKAKNSDNINRKFPSLVYNSFDHPGLSR